MIDMNKTLSFYLKQNYDISYYFSIVIKEEEKIQVCVYNEDNKKIYDSFQQIPVIIDKICLNIKKEFIELNKSNDFNELINYINELIENDMGKQNEIKISKIFLFEKRTNININLYNLIVLGVIHSLNFPFTQEATLIFKIIDDKDISERDKFNEFIISNQIYKINKSLIKILIDEDVPFDGSFYKTINIYLKKRMNMKIY